MAIGSLINVGNRDLSAFPGAQFDWPTLDGLEYLNLFDSEAVLGRNLAPGKPAATVVGSPTVADYEAQFTSNVNYIDTGVAQSDDMTFIAVGRKATDGNGFMVGNFNGITNGGVWLWFSQATPADGQVAPTFSNTMNNGGAISNSVLTAGAQMAVPSTAKAYAARYRSSDRQKVFNRLTAGLTGTTTPAYPMAIGASTLRIGSSVVTNAGTVFINAVGIYSRSILDAEMTEIDDRLQAIYADRSIAI